MDAIAESGENLEGKRLTILRAIDKMDRLGADGIRLLLGDGRKDESGDFTSGAGLSHAAIEATLAATSSATPVSAVELGGASYSNAMLEEATADLGDIERLVRAAGYEADQIVIDPSVVRGLEYYTGPVYEVELTFETVNERGEKARFGSVAGGGRYDGLVARFRGEEVPACGFSLGVSRLQAALAALDRIDTGADTGPVVVLVMDHEEIAGYQQIAARLRETGIRAEMYLGTSGMKAQMKYADRRGAPCVIIQGSNERERGVHQVKDLIEGARLAAGIEDREEYREQRPAQIEVADVDLVTARARDSLASRA